MSVKWSPKFDKCVECGTTERPHRSLGFCTSCYHRQYREKNRERMNKNSRLHKQQPHIKAKRKEYNQRPEVKERNRIKAKNWRERNYERTLEIQRNWRERNPDKIKEYNERPEVKERNRRRWINKKYGENGFLVLERDDYICRKCGSKKQISIHHIDWDENNNDLDNLIVFCNSCHKKLHSFLPSSLRLQVFEIWMKTLL